MNVSSNKDRVRKKNVLTSLMDISGISVSVATFLISLFVAYDVIARTVFRLNNSWITEVTIYLMGYITFVGSAYALKVGAHVGVDILIQLVSINVKKILSLIADFVLFIVVIILTWLSFQLFFDAWNSNEKSDTLLSVRLWIPYLSFFIGMVLLLVATLMQTLAHLSNSTNKNGVI